MAFLKQDEVKGNGQKSKKKSNAAKTDKTALVPDGESNGIAEAIRHFASIFSTYVTNELSGDNGQPLFTTPNGYPVKIAFGDDFQQLTLFVEGEAVESIADSLKRIADALAIKMAGA